MLRRILGAFIAAVGTLALMGAVWAFLNGAFPSETADARPIGYNAAAIGLILIGVTLLRVGGKVWDSGPTAPETDPASN